MNKDINIVKKVCKELGVTQKELAELLGVGVDTINKSASTGKVSKQLETSIYMLLEIKNLKNKLTTFNDLKNILKNIIS